MLANVIDSGEMGPLGPLKPSRWCPKTVSCVSVLVHLQLLWGKLCH
jgi:hypothetical protein